MPTPLFTPQSITEVIRIDPLVHRDHRGFFVETHNQRVYTENGIPYRFVQDNASRSGQHTLRGLHAQVNHPQAKLVRVVSGEIFDVAVDIREGSPTFGQWVGMNLSADNFCQLFIPPGFAHGFCVISESAEVSYKVSALYDASDEIAIAHDDPDIGIAWPTDAPILSEKDEHAPRLSTLTGRLPRWESRL